MCVERVLIQICHQHLVGLIYELIVIHDGCFNLDVAIMSLAITFL